MDAEHFADDVAARVRAIVAEAEQRAASIVREAEQEASRIREQAETESEGKLRLVRAALEELQAKLGVGAAATANGASAEVEPGPVTVPEPAPPLIPEPAPDPVPEPTPDPVPEPTPPPDEGTPPQPDPVGPAAGSKSGDATAARLVAMNMALDGASREQIEGHLAESYALTDTGAIVDDVLALTAR